MLLLLAIAILLAWLWIWLHSARNLAPHAAVCWMAIMLYGIRYEVLGVGD
jgi:hypothetical protein